MFAFQNAFKIFFRDEQFSFVLSQILVGNGTTQNNQKEKF